MPFSFAIMQHVNNGEIYINLRVSMSPDYSACNFLGTMQLFLTGATFWSSNATFFGYATKKLKSPHYFKVMGPVMKTNNFI